MSKLTGAKERIGLVTEISMLPSLGVTGPVLDELLKVRDRLLAEAVALLQPEPTANVDRATASAVESIRGHLRYRRHPNTSVALLLGEACGGGINNDESIRNVTEALTLEGYVRVFRAERGNGEFDGWVRQLASAV